MTTPVTDSRAEWLVTTLLGNKVVTFDEFQNKFFDQLNQAEGKKSATPAWSTACNSVIGALRPTEYLVEKQQVDGVEQLVLRGRPEQPHHLATEYFRTDHFAMEKQKIGEIVAPYLKFQRHWHCFLGSGSTILNIGLEMSKVAQKLGEQYSQSFWSINLPLLVEWARKPEESPVSEVEVPQGYLKVKKGRYRDVQPPSWDTPIVVVAADGCYYDEQEGKARLFSDDADIAKVTTQLIQLAKDTVICCIASPKLEYPGESLSGPYIKPPEKAGVQVILVVDKRPDDQTKLEGLKNEGWKYEVVSDVTQWPAHCKHVKKQEAMWKEFLCKLSPSENHYQ